MKESENIEQLKKQLAEAERRIQNCKHVFNKPVFDPETVKEGYGSVQDGAGSDPHWSYAGYRDVQKDRWSRECSICGKKEYTYKQEPVITNYEPKF
jgi:hypothetical protein